MMMMMMMTHCIFCCGLLSQDVWGAVGPVHTAQKWGHVTAVETQRILIVFVFCVNG
jgi:hypothetical protein